MADGDYVLDFNGDFEPIYGYDFPAEQRPRTVQELCDRTCSWTYTYLSLTPGAVTGWQAVSVQRLMRLFGTDKPTVEMVQSDWDWNEANGSYVVVYTGGNPVAYFLWGCDDHK